MTLRQLIKQLLDEMGEIELEDVLADNDLMFEVYNKSSACLVTITIEQLSIKNSKPKAQ